MARNTKKGLDYSPWDVNIFDGDRKIDKLLESQGCTGFVIYFYLCQMAYKFEGYFYPWSYDDSATTAKRVGGGAGSETVRQTVGLCLQMGLFDKRLFDRYGILTSRGIQARFLDATTRRVGNSVIQEYWLLEKESSNGLVFCTLNSDSCNKNPDSCNKKADSCNDNSTERKEEESKGEKREEEESSGCSASSSSKLSSAVAFFLDRVNPTASERCLEELAEFEKDLGAPVCIRAMMVALDEGKSGWNYIRAILRNKQTDGIRSLEAWDAHETARSSRKQRKDGQRGHESNDGGGSVAEQYGVKPDLAL